MENMTPQCEGILKGENDMVKAQTIAGLCLALSPVVHNEILEIGAPVTKGEAKRARTMTFLVKNANDAYEAVPVPIVSGNAVRGLMRRLIVDHSLDELGLTGDAFGALFDSNEEARRTLFLLRNGGLTAKSVSPKPIGVGGYDRLRKGVPFLALLGGNYQGHHIESCCQIGFLVPLTKETVNYGLNGMPAEITAKVDPERLPVIVMVNNAPAIRYTRRAGEEKEGSEDKEAMIYGTEVIPPGVTFYSFNTCVTDDEGAALAFRAGMAMLAEHGYIGGMKGRGHGRVSFDLMCVGGSVAAPLDPAGSIAAYDRYLRDNKEAITEAISEIPKILAWVDKKQGDDGEEKPKGKGKKGAE